MQEQGQRHVGDVLSERFHHLIDEIADPSVDRKLVTQLHDMFGELWCAAEIAGVERQGRVILAALRGELVAWDGCEPQLRYSDALDEVPA